MTDIPLIHGEWRQSRDRIKEYFDQLPAPGGCALTFEEETSFEEFYHMLLSVDDGILNGVISVWYQQLDYKRSKTEFNFEPTIRKESIRLAGEDLNGFADFFESISVEAEQLLFDRRRVVILDGCRYRMKLFRNGIKIRSFEWDSGAKLLGAMKFVTRFYKEARFKSGKS